MGEQNINHYEVLLVGTIAYIGLMAAENASGLYEKFGFTRRPENAPGMDKRVS